MRGLQMLLLGGALLVSSLPVNAAPSRQPEFYTPSAVLAWINTYRSKPDAKRAAAAIHALSGMGELRNPEAAGVYLGFAAGVLASNPADAEELVDKMLPVPAEDQWLIVRAIAYSGIPNWRGVLARISGRLPARHALVQKYLAGALPTLREYRQDEPERGWMQKVGDYVSFAPKPKDKSVLGPSPQLLDTFWGFYYATGDSMSLQRVVTLLPWSKNHDDVDKLTLGGMAKYTLAENASRDAVLLATLKTIRRSEPNEVRPVLDEVIEAADDVDTSHVRKEMLAALEELKRKGPESKRQLTLWGQVGQGAIAAGCIAAAVVGQVEFGIPCVVGGAVSSGALNIWASQN